MTAPLDLAAVKAHLDGVSAWDDGHALTIAHATALVAEVERLAAENARLRAVRDAAAEYVAAMRMTDEADGAELDGADVDAVGAMEREDSAKEQLDAALRAAGGG